MGRCFAAPIWAHKILIHEVAQWEGAAGQGEGTRRRSGAGWRSGAVWCRARGHNNVRGQFKGTRWGEAMFGDVGQGNVGWQGG